MKTIEEKAKAYDEALELMRDCVPDENGLVHVRPSDIFSELAESEERIKKEITNLVMQPTWKTEKEFHRRKELVAWLEKQGEQKAKIADFKAKDWYVSKVDGKIYNAKFMEKTPNNQARRLEIEKAAMSATGIIEQEEWFIKGAEWSDENPSYISSEKQGKQKPADEVEPTFKVGNWYQCTKDFFGKGVTFDKNTAYYCAEEGCLQDEYGCHIAIVKDLYDNFKLWTIQDAKDGDVLASKDKEDILIYKSHSVIDLLLTSHISFSKKEGFCPRQYSAWDINEFIPATKEQRDTLEKAMADAGYTFDFEKKELKKIEQKSAEWSEENETGFTNTIIMLKEGASLHFIKKDITKAVDWLKSLKERIGG